MNERRNELAAALSAVEERLAAAASHAGRSPADVTLVVVTKTWPVEDLRRLYDLGVRHFGENRHQEAEPKAAALADCPGVVWHFVGQVQSNKASRIAQYADMVHSVDSLRVAQRLAAGARRHRRTVDCLVQVSLDPARSGDRDEPAERGGVSAEQVAHLADAIEAAEGLRLAGVMGIGPLNGDPGAAYRTLARHFDELSATHPGVTVMSAGMSGDFESAIAAGATHVRIGSAILGQRPSIG